MSMIDLTEELARTELFQNASATVLRAVAESAAPLDLAKGAVLLSPEQNNLHVYLLLSGKLGVYFGSIDSPEIRELNPGVSVGEMSVIDGILPSAYVVAKENCRVFPIHRDLLHDMVVDASPMAGNLLRLLTQWMRANTQRILKDRTEIWELTDHANVDALTRLYNRRWLDNALERLLDQAVKGMQPLCLLLIDVDHFKRYNDTQGHVGGDQALVAMGEVLKMTVRPYDFAVRYGGEEFLVILPNTKEDEGIAVAERIRQNVAKKVIVSAEGVPLAGLTVSIGMAMAYPDASPRSLISAADTQLYMAKRDGRNCIRY